MTFVMRASMLFVLVVAFGCGKKDEPKKDEIEKKADKKDEAKKDDKQDDKKAEAKKDDTKKDEAKTASDDAKELTVAEYEKKSAALLVKATDFFKSLPTDGKDCDKTAAALDKFLDDNKAENDATEAFEKSHAAAKQQFDDKHKDEIGKVESLAKAVIEPCAENAAMQAAVKRLAPGE